MRGAYHVLVVRGGDEDLLHARQRHVRAHHLLEALGQQHPPEHRPQHRLLLLWSDREPPVVKTLAGQLSLFGPVSPEARPASAALPWPAEGRAALFRTRIAAAA